MTVHQSSIAPPAGDTKTQIASAVRAVEAAMAACEAARLVLLSLVKPEPELIVDPQTGECRHPASQAQAIETFGETVYFCSICGEQLGV